MKSVRIHHYGSFEQLRYEEVPVPEAGKNQVLVKVYAATVNRLDIKRASGAMKESMPLTFPWIPGYDFAGIIEETGSNVTGFTKGDKIYGNCMGGSYAEYLAADVHKIVKIPEILSFAEASSVPHVGETAWQALYKHGKLKKGETVLIHGGAGAVGEFAVQFAHNTGAYIISTASKEDIPFVKSLGADEVIDFRTEDFTRMVKDVDLVLCLVGGDIEERSYSVLKKGGRLVSAVGVFHQEIAKLNGIESIAMLIEQSADDLKRITELIKDGKVKTDIGASYPLADVVTAWKVVSGDKSVTHPSHGKIVLKVNPE